MAYEKVLWQDRIKDGQGNIIQEGTPFSAGNMNNIFDGLDMSHLNIGVLATFLAQQTGSNTKEISKIKNQRIIQGQATLTNADQSGYFRTSDPFATVAITGYPQINAPNYTVLLEVLSADDLGRVGELTAYEKTQNGFKVSMSGSAKNVTFMWTIINPNV